MPRFVSQARPTQSALVVFTKGKNFVKWYILLLLIFVTQAFLPHKQPDYQLDITDPFGQSYHSWDKPLISSGVEPIKQTQTFRHNTHNTIEVFRQNKK